MRAGELRRFRSSAFAVPATLSRFNCETFIVLSIKPRIRHQHLYRDVEILICGEVSTGWTDKTIMDCSEVIDG